MYGTFNRVYRVLAHRVKLAHQTPLAPLEISRHIHITVKFPFSRRRNVCSEKKNTKCSDVLRLRLVFFFSERTLRYKVTQPEMFDFQPKVTRILTIVCKGELFNLDYFTTTLMSEFESFLH